MEMGFPPGDASLQGAILGDPEVLVGERQQPQTSLGFGMTHWELHSLLAFLRVPNSKHCAAMWRKAGPAQAPDPSCRGAGWTQDRVVPALHGCWGQSQVRALSVTHHPTLLVMPVRPGEEAGRKDSTSRTPTHGSKAMCYPGQETQLQ